MKRHHIIKAAAVPGLLLVGLLISGYFRPEPPKVATANAKPEVVAPPSLSDNNSMTLPVQTANLNPVMRSSQVPISRHDQLIALHGIGELFGVGADARMKQFQDFVENLDAADVSVMVRELQELQMNNPTATGRDLQLRLLRRWAASDLRAAADWTIKMPAGSDRQEAIAALSGASAEHNFNEAVTWAMHLTDDVEQQSALGNVVNAAIYLKPQDALTLASTFPPGSMRDDMITRSAESWAFTAPEEAASYAKQIPDEALREQAISAIAATWGGTDPVAAGNLVMDSMPAGSSQDQAVVAIVQHLAATDPSGAKAWIGQFPEGALRQAANTMLEHSLVQAGPHFQPTVNGQQTE
jgi:hypothetical protein